jgi:hypothetical protein
MSVGQTAHGITVLGLALAALGCLLMGRGRIRGTTLVAPWSWTLLAVLALSGAECWIFSHAATASAGQMGNLRYAAALLTLCPIMALLGAKRPQNRAWQFIVVSLWVVLVMPLAEASIYRPQAALDLYVGLRWFLLILIGLGLINGLSGRFWPSYLLVALCQLGLLGPHLPLPEVLVPQFDGRVLAALGLGTCALGLWAFDWPRPIAWRRSKGIERVWFDFRDAYGILWAVRVSERFNAAAQRYGWGIRLGQDGVITDAPAQGAVPTAEVRPETNPVLLRCFRMLMRRFVSEAWIRDRIGEAGDAA